jgi:hypothetical protein
MEGSPWLLFAAAAATLFAIVQSARLAWRSWAPRVRFRARMAHAARGERNAESILARHGYEILDRQASATIDYAVDGQSRAIDVRADYLVAREGRVFVAEVKTGRDAPAIASAATRRQLLEYAHAFDLDGVLLVDADRERVHAIGLPARPARRVASPFRDLLLFATGAACASIAWALITRNF